MADFTYKSLLRKVKKTFIARFKTTTEANNNKNISAIEIINNECQDCFSNILNI